MTYIQLLLARDPDTPPEVLNGLLDNSNPNAIHNPFCDEWDIWYYLSLNPSTPTVTLIKLSEICLKNGFYKLINNITKHPNTPTNLKQYLLARSYVQSSSDV